MEPTLITPGTEFVMGQNGVRWTLGIISAGQSFYFEAQVLDSLVIPTPVAHYIAVGTGTWFADVRDYLIRSSERRIGISSSRLGTSGFNNFSLVPTERIASGRRMRIFQVNF